MIRETIVCFKPGEKKNRRKSVCVGGWGGGWWRGNGFLIFKGCFSFALSDLKIHHADGKK